MHVLMTADTVGGVWTYTQELVSGLERRGIRVSLVSMGALPTPKQTAWMEGLPSLNYLPTRFRMEWMQNSEKNVINDVSAPTQNKRHRVFEEYKIENNYISHVP